MAFACALALPAGAQDEQGVALGLSEALRLLVENNNVIKRERETLVQSEARLAQAMGARDWMLFAQTSVRRAVIPESRNGFLTDQNREDKVLAGTIGARRTFSNGVSLSPSVSVVENLDDQSDTLAEVPTLANLELSVPLLKGFGANAASAPELVAGHAVRAARGRTSRVVQRAVHAAVVAYWRCLAAQQLLRQREHMQAQMSDYAGSIKALASGGEISIITRQRVDADVALRTLDVDEALDRLDEARRALALALGISGRPLPLAAGDFPPLLERGALERVAVPALVQMALENRPDLRSLGAVVQARESGLEEAENGLLPQLDLNLALDRVELVFSRPLDNRLAKGRVSERRSTVKQARLDVAILASAIRGEVEAAHHELESSIRTHQRAAETTRLLASVRRATRQGVASGESGVDSLLAVEDKLTLASLKIIESKLQYATALADLRLVTGTIRHAAQGEALVAGDFLRPPGGDL